MKKMLLVVLTVLAMATVANAALTAKISVNGVVDPPGTSIILMPSETAIIDIHAWNNVSASSALLVMQGPGLLSKGQMWLWEQSTFTMPSADFAGWKEALEGMGYMGITQIADLDILDLVEPFTTPAGRVLDGVVFHCEAIGDVTLTVMDLDMNPLDSQVIHQIPEPITMVLLGLGGLFLRRK